MNVLDSHGHIRLTGVVDRMDGEISALISKSKVEGGKYDFYCLRCLHRMLILLLRSLQKHNDI